MPRISASQSERQDRPEEEEPSPYDTLCLTGDKDGDDNGKDNDSGTFVSADEKDEKEEEEEEEENTMVRTDSVIIHDELPTPSPPVH